MRSPDTDATAARAGTDATQCGAEAYRVRVRDRKHITAGDAIGDVSAGGRAEVPEYVDDDMRIGGRHEHIKLAGRAGGHSGVPCT